MFSVEDRFGVSPEPNVFVFNKLHLMEHSYCLNKFKHTASKIAIMRFNISNGTNDWLTCFDKLIELHPISWIN